MSDKSSLDKEHGSVGTAFKGKASTCPSPAFLLTQRQRTVHLGAQLKKSVVPSTRRERWASNLPRAVLLAGQLKARRKQHKERSQARSMRKE